MMDISALSTRYRVTHLTEAELPRLLELCQGNPLYYHHCPPAVSTESLRADMEALPPQKSPEDKYYLGFWDGEALAAVLDLILGYPNETTALIGFFMMDAARQGRGAGSALVEEICACLGRVFSAVRLGYVKGNPQSEHFWRKNGFAPTGTVTQNERYEVVWAERALCPEAVAYREFGAELLGHVLELYRDAGWTAYLGDDAALERALTHSLYILGAFDGERLVGFVRCVGDGEHILYIQDLLVHNDWKRRGIGRSLLKRALERYAHVRMISLTTDSADPVSNAFYRAVGFKPYPEGGCAGYLC